MPRTAAAAAAPLALAATPIPTTQPIASSAFTAAAIPQPTCAPFTLATTEPVTPFAQPAASLS